MEVTMKIYNKTDAAKALGVSRQTVDKWIKQKKLRCIETANGSEVVPQWAIDEYFRIEKYRKIGRKLASLRKNAPTEKQLISMIESLGYTTVIIEA